MSSAQCQTLLMLTSICVTPLTCCNVQFVQPAPGDIGRSFITIAILLAVLRMPLGYWIHYNRQQGHWPQRSK